MKTFWTVLKYFGISAGTLATLYAGFTFFDGMRDDIGDVKKEVVEFSQTTDSILVTVKMLDKRSLQNSEDIADTDDRTELVMESYLRHIRNDNSLTKEEFIEYMDPFLEYVKKNSSYINQQLWTPYYPDSISEKDINRGGMTYR